MTSIVLLLILATPTATEVGTSRTFGFGLQAGSPTGVTMKSFFTPEFAFDLGAGWGGMYRRGRCWDRHEHEWYYCGGWDRHNFTLHTDFLWELPITSRVHWHVGPGVRLVMWDDEYYDERGSRRNSHVFVRVPIGLDMNWRSVELFFEVAPNILPVPLDVGIDAVVGVRFYPQLSQ